MTFEYLLNKNELKKLLMVSFLSSLGLSVAAYLYPLDFYAHLSIPNNEGYFSLAELKRLKNKLPIEAQPLIASVSDLDLRKFLQETTLEPKWIEKNVTSTLAITRSDAKDLAIQNQNVNLDVMRVSWINVDTYSKKEELSKVAASWIGELICKVSYKEEINDYINSVRSEADAQLQTIYKQLPMIEKSIDQMQENIKILTEVNKKYPESNSDQSKLQLNLSVGEYRENLNNLSFLTAYLSPIKQLAILETQLAQTLDTKKRLNLEKGLVELIREVANHELENLTSKRLNELFKDSEVIYEFWPNANLKKALPAQSPEWLNTYVNELNSQHYKEEQIRGDHFKRQMSQLNSIFVEKKFDKLSLILGAAIFGFFLPLTIFIFPKIIKRLINGWHL